MKTILILAVSILLTLINLQSVHAESSIYQTPWVNARTLMASDSSHEFQITNIVAQPYTVSWQMVDKGQFDGAGQPILSVVQTKRPAIVVTVSYETPATGNDEELASTSREVTFVFQREDFTPEQVSAIEATTGIEARRNLANRVLELQINKQSKNISIPRCENISEMDNYYDMSCNDNTPCPQIQVDAKYVVLQVQKRTAG